MKNIQPPISQERLQASYASAALWLARLVELLTRWTHPRATGALKHFVRRKERSIACVLFLTAIARIRHQPTPHTRFIRKPGFRLTQGNIKLLLKSARIARKDAPIRERILYLIHAFAHPERYIRYFIKRLRHGVRVLRLIAAAPAADALTPAPIYAIACADSS